MPRSHFATVTSSVLGDYVLQSKCRTMRLKPWEETLSSSLLIRLFEVLVVGQGELWKNRVGSNEKFSDSDALFAPC